MRNAYAFQYFFILTATHYAYILCGMTQSTHIISLFGGIRPLAKALGHNNPSTVQGWLRRGYIPARQQAAVLDAAKRADIPFTTREFFFHEEGS